MAGIAKAMEFILGLPEGPKRLIEAVGPLSKAFALAVPSDAAPRIRDEVGFFRPSAWSWSSSSRFGVVIVSSSFLAKRWPQTELDGLVALEMIDGKKRILPIWYDVEYEEVARRSPSLAAQLAALNIRPSRFRRADEKPKRRRYDKVIMAA